MKVSVVGAGNGGCALAFHLVQLGHEVLLYSSGKYNNTIKAIKSAGCVNALKERMGTRAALHGSSMISKITSDIEEALQFGNVIMTVVPSFCQAELFKSALPHLNDKHIFISMPGNFAFLDQIKIVQENSNHDICEKLPFTLVETSSIPYASRLVDRNNVFVSGTKRLMHVGVYPSSRTQAILDVIRPLFSLKLEAQENVIATGLNNLNCILHPTIALQNAGWIESTKGDFLFYKQGASPSILNFMEALDKERMAVGESLGFEMKDYLSTLKLWYGDVTSTSLKEYFKIADCYNGIKAPASLNNRFITEDINYLLAPVIKTLATKKNISTPVSNAMMTVAHALTGLPMDAARNFNDFPMDLNII